MWKDFSASYIKNNRTSGISVIVGVFIASLFLSFLCCLFYNFWLDEIAGITQEEGDWHGRITGEVTEEDLAFLLQFSNVEKAVINTDLSKAGETVVDISFYKKSRTYQDMRSIMNTLGYSEEEITYHYQLLSMYFIRIPGDEAPRLIMPFYLIIIVIVCLSMILVIHNSFAISMHDRVHQFGILSSIGATPRQIRTCLLQEAAMLALVPALAGILCGIGLSFATLMGISTIVVNVAGSRSVNFHYHPAIFAITFLSSAFTVLFSAWLPAGKLSKLTPLEAIRGTGELELTTKKHSPVLSALFGMEGELAGNALKAQRKALRTTSLSLTLSFFGFMMILCFFTLSGISTNHTYFAKYQNVWDIMVVVKEIGIEKFTYADDIQSLPEARNGTIYQKAEAVSLIPKDEISETLQAIGGPEAVAASAVTETEDGFLIKTPVIIMDDNSFLGYCEEIGISPGLDGAILLNRIWDSIHSNFRYRKYLPYVKEDKKTTTLQSIEMREKSVKIPVLANTQEYPALREEYEDYALVHFIPLSLWKESVGEIGGSDQDTYIRILATEEVSLAKLNTLEGSIKELLEKDYAIESENRIQEKITNDEIIGSYEFVLSAFCFLLAMIGIANVFSNTLGFLRRRKREFVRYMSVGLTPKGMLKIFCIEALVVAGRPVLITLPLTIISVAFMIKASFLDPMEFIVAAPIVPVFSFILSVFGFIAFAYYLGGRKILRSSLKPSCHDPFAMI